MAVMRTRAIPPELAPCIPHKGPRSEYIWGYYFRQQSSSNAAWTVDLSAKVGISPCLAQLRRSRHEPACLMQGLRKFPSFGTEKEARDAAISMYNRKCNPAVPASIRAGRAAAAQRQASPPAEAQPAKRARAQPMASPSRAQVPASRHAGAEQPRGSVAPAAAAQPAAAAAAAATSSFQLPPLLRARAAQQDGRQWARGYRAAARGGFYLTMEKHRSKARC